MESDKLVDSPRERGLRLSAWMLGLLVPSAGIGAMIGRDMAEACLFAGPTLLLLSFLPLLMASIRANPKMSVRGLSMFLMCLACWVPVGLATWAVLMAATALGASREAVAAPWLVATIFAFCVAWQTFSEPALVKFFSSKSR